MSINKWLTLCYDTICTREYMQPYKNTVKDEEAPMNWCGKISKTYLTSQQPFEVGSIILIFHVREYCSILIQYGFETKPFRLHPMPFHHLPALRIWNLVLLPPSCGAPYAYLSGAASWGTSTPGSLWLPELSESVVMPTLHVIFWGYG